MTTQQIGGILLVERLIAASFLFSVLRKQIALFRSSDVSTGALRKVLFFMTLTSFLGQFIPIMIDIAALAGAGGISHNPALLGVAYAFSNATTAIIESSLLWLVYKISAEENIKLTKRNTMLQTSNTNLKSNNIKLRKKQG